MKEGIKKESIISKLKSFFRNKKAQTFGSQTLNADIRSGGGMSTGIVVFFTLFAWLIFAIDRIWGQAYYGFRFVGDIERTSNIAVSVLQHVVFLTFVGYYLAIKLIRGEWKKKDIWPILSNITLLATITLFLFFPFWTANIRAIIHFLFIFSFYFFIRNMEGPVLANFGVTSLIFIDFFGYFLYGKFELMQYIPILPLAVFLYLAAKKTSVITILNIIVIAILTVLFAPNTTFTQQIGGIVTPEMGDQGKSFIDELKDKAKATQARITREIQKSFEYATGGYYVGEVEDNVHEPLGVYLEGIKQAQKEFYIDEDIILWATLKARTLEKDKEVNITLNCFADRDLLNKYEGKQADEMIPPSIRNPETPVSVFTMEERDVGCKFNKGAFDKEGRHVISFVANFNFKTMAYLKTYFMDINRKRSLIREDIDPLDEYKITDKTPAAVYTNGPMMIGAETTKSLPVGVYTDGTQDTMPRLGITLQNQWLGRIKEIKDLTIQIPKSMEILKNDKGLLSCDFNITYEGMSEDKEFRVYKLKDLNSDRLKNIEDYRSFNCILKVSDPLELLGKTPLSIKYYRISAEYTYELEEPTSIRIESPKFIRQPLTSCIEECLYAECVCPEGCTMMNKSGVIYKGETCNELKRSKPVKINNCNNKCPANICTCPEGCIVDEGKEIAKGATCGGDIPESEKCSLPCQTIKCKCPDYCVKKKGTVIQKGKTCNELKDCDEKCPPLMDSCTCPEGCVKKEGTFIGKYMDCGGKAEAGT